MELLRASWVAAFDRLLDSATKDLFIVSPFIKREAMQQASRFVRNRSGLRVTILTNFAPKALIGDAMDASAIFDFCEDIHAATVTHLAGLHAKVFIADNRQAIVTSGNLTDGGLFWNYEYGVLFDEVDVVRRVRQDMEAMRDLGCQWGMPT
ncbi:MAG: hypothetical protein FJ318_03320 [SAR202 cluster bacterium]|nr:hypothetical protein [SAR202 cluster bacterium]